jgi:hypothetical protein
MKNPKTISIGFELTQSSSNRFLFSTDLKFFQQLLQPTQCVLNSFRTGPKLFQQFANKPKVISSFFNRSFFGQLFFLADP